MRASLFYLLYAIIPLSTTSTKAAPLTQTSASSTSTQSSKKEILGVFDTDWITGVRGDVDLDIKALENKLKLWGMELDEAHQQHYDPSHQEQPVEGNWKGPSPDSPLAIQLASPALLANVTLTSHALKLKHSFTGKRIFAKGFTAADIGGKEPLAELSALNAVGLVAASGKLSTWPTKGTERPVILIKAIGKPLDWYPCFEEKRRAGGPQFQALLTQLRDKLRKHIWTFVKQKLMLNSNLGIDSVNVVVDEKKCQIQSIQSWDWAYPGVFTVDPLIVKQPAKFDEWFNSRFDAFYFREFPKSFQLPEPHFSEFKVNLGNLS